MAPISRKRSLADMQHAEGVTITASAPAEYNDCDFFLEVLRLEAGKSELDFDEALNKTAKNLGIDISRPPTPAQDPHTSICGSATTAASNHARTTSTGSYESASTALTSRTSHEQLGTSLSGQLKKRTSHRRSLSFSEYDKYLVETESQQSKNLGFVPPPMPAEPAPSLFSISSRGSYQSIRNGLKTRFRLRRIKTASSDDFNSCICCRDDFRKTKALHTLPCQHNYCDACLRTVVTQASAEEAKMPPRCCSKAIPGKVIKCLLNREEQHTFMKAVLQYSTPWESRIFCPNTECGEFIPKRAKIDPKHPFEVVCRKCRTRACSICKRAAHAFGQDCPADWELDAVLQMGEKSGWRRCYKCRNLVELTQGCTHITCRCKAQFCYICGAVWDQMVGCPNYCNGEEELERRRMEEEAREAELEAEKVAREEAEQAEAAEKLASEKRTQESEVLNSLRARQINERDRFDAFERKMNWLMWTRHGQTKLDLLDRYGELQSKMKDRHARTATHLEDRQVGAEMELRATLKQAERSVAIRLRHMEAYCDGLGRSASGDNPARTVTERDLRELGQQYNIRDDLERLHQSRINVMRDKQAKQMEHLLVRQEDELEKLSTKQADEVLALEDTFAAEEETFTAVFSERRKRVSRRWVITEEIERKKLETKYGARFAPMAPLGWPDIENKNSGLLEDVAE